MKLIIAGTRTLKVSPLEIKHLLEHFNLQPVEIVSGGANGIDKCGEFFAGFYHLHLSRFVADWDKYGKAAGPKRNAHMADYADALLLIWDGKSPGSKSMKLNMELVKKPVFSVIVNENNVGEFNG